MHPDERQTWLTEGLWPEFTTFLSLGTRATKGVKGKDAEAIFKMYSLGVVTNRDTHVYSFDNAQLSNRVSTFVDIYNSAVDKLKRRGREIDSTSLIDITDPRIKWTRQVKASLTRLQYSQYDEAHIRNSLYRPFTR